MTAFGDTGVDAGVNGVDDVQQADERHKQDEPPGQKTYLGGLAIAACLLATCVPLRKIRRMSIVGAIGAVE